MQIEVRRARFGTGVNYEVLRDKELLMKGHAPALLKAGVVRLEQADSGEAVFSSRYRANSLADWLLPFTIGARRRKIFICELLSSTGESIAVLTKIGYHTIKQAYTLQAGKMLLEILPLHKSKREALLVFNGPKQLAHIERDTVTYDSQDSYTIYLPDEYREYINLLIMFTLCYDHMNYANKGKTRHGYKRQDKAWSYTDANERYERGWLEEHFPEAKCSPIFVNAEYNRAAQIRLTTIAFVKALSGVFAVALAIIWGIRYNPQALVIYTLLIAVWRLYDVWRFKQYRD